ncbi:MAG: fused MFS/spermidine synthase, partial [Planctomycetota bacterium]
LAGFSSLAYEIAWTRVLSAMIGSSVYAFSMMLCAFILGLASGSLVFGRFVDRIRDPLRALAFIQAAIGFSALLVVPLIGQLPYIATSAIASFSGSFVRLQLVEFGIILMVMLVPTTLMGASFPLASRLYIRRERSVSQAVGTVYAANTIGTIAGSFAGGFVLIPVFHIQSTILIAVFVNVLVACAFLRFGAAPERQAHAAKLVLGLLAVFAIGALMIPPWDVARMSVGPFEQGRFLYQGSDSKVRNHIDKLAEFGTVLYHNEGVATTVTVKEFRFPDEPSQITLFVNGTADASSGGDMPTQILSGQIPMLLHPDPQDVLVIGLASGITLGAAATHDTAQSLDCAEISPGVIEACVNFFYPYNHNVTDDPRVNVITTDGRNHVALTEKTYDVIISEPSNPWIAGIGDLFTREFFATSRDRLNDDGLLLVWFNAYNNNAANFASVLATFHEVFPEMRLFSTVAGSDYLMVGAKDGFDVPFDRLVRRMNQPRVAADLKRIGVETPADLLGHLVMGPGGIEAFSGGAPIVTDDNALLEFSIPRVMANMQRGARILEGFDQHLDADFGFIQPPGDTDWPGLAESYGLSLQLATATQTTKLNRILSGGHLSKAQQMMAEERPKEQILEYFRKAAEVDPLSSGLLMHVDVQIANANRLLLDGDTELAEEISRDLVAILPNNPKPRVLLGLILYRTDRIAEALEHFNHALVLNPFDHQALLLVGRAQQGLGRIAEAADAYTRSLELKADNFPALTQLSWIRSSAPDEALRDAEQANTYARLADALARRGYAEALDNFGVALATSNQLEQALQVTAFASQLVANLGETEVGARIAKHLDDYNKNIIPQNTADSFQDNNEVLFHRRQLTEQARLDYATTLDTVAAARAAAGRFDQAAQAAGQAIALVESTDPELPLIDEIKARLTLYENEQPYRMETPSDGGQ